MPLLSSMYPEPDSSVPEYDGFHAGGLTIFDREVSPQILLGYPADATWSNSWPKCMLAPGSARSSLAYLANSH